MLKAGARSRDVGTGRYEAACDIWTQCQGKGIRNAAAEMKNGALATDAAHRYRGPVLWTSDSTARPLAVTTASNQWVSSVLCPNRDSNPQRGGVAFRRSH